MHRAARRGARAALSTAIARAGWSLLTLLVPAAVLAQGAPGSVQVGVEAGRFVGGTLAKGSSELFDVTVAVDQNPTGGFWLAGQISREWGVEFSYRRTATEIIGAGSGLFGHQKTLAGLDVASIEALAVRSFRYGNFVPYLGGGVGLTNLDPDTDDPSQRDSNHGCLSLTGGARFYVARWVGIRVDVRGRATYLGVRGQGEDGGLFDTGRWFFDTEFLGGVFFSFGGT